MINRARVENFEIRNFKIIMYTKNGNVNVFSPLKIDIFSKIAPRNLVMQTYFPPLKIDIFWKIAPRNHPLMEIRNSFPVILFRAKRGEKNYYILYYCIVYHSILYSSARSAEKILLYTDYYTIVLYIILYHTLPREARRKC